MLPSTTKGVIELKVASSGVSSTARLLLTDLSLVAKKTSVPDKPWMQNVKIWALDMKSNELLDGVTVQLVRKSGKSVATCVTDGDAGCSLIVKEGDPDQAEPFALIAKHGDDLTYLRYQDLRADVTVLTGNNFDPIAPDVEVLQVAYGINRARATLTCCTTAPDTGGTPNTNFIMGDELTEGIVANPTGVLSTLPDYRAGYDDPSRYVSHPANIRSVHVAMVMRSSRALPDGRRDFTSADVFNWDSPTPARDGFKRTFFHTALNTPNLISRSGFAPALRSSADLRDLNSWGG